MPEFNIALIVSSFVAGIFTFFAPCTLPLIPAFLGVISGVGADEFNDPEKLAKLKWKIFTHALLYCIGFSIVFIFFGVAFSLLGKVFLFREWFQRIGGAFIILFGLVLLGWLKLDWLMGEKKIRAPRLYQSASKFNSFLIGMLFALGWTPCVGVLLGSILLLASSTGTIIQGTFLLVVFSIGLAAPFLITAMLIGKAYSAFGRIGMMKTLKVINIIAGLFLVFLGILLISDQFTFIFNIFRGYFIRIPFYEEFILKFL